MKRTRARIFAASVLLISACASVRTDGDAVECTECHTMWVRLLAASPAPGLYLLGDQRDKRRACPRCGEIAVRFFETGAMPRRCPACGGRLAVHPVNVTH